MFQIISHWDKEWISMTLKRSITKKYFFPDPYDSSYFFRSLFGFLLNYLLSRPNLRSAFNNQAIIAFLGSALPIQLIDIPFCLNSLHVVFVWPQLLTLCVIGWSAGVPVYNTSSIPVAWLSFEGHLLVFHDQYVSTRKKRWLFHYLPLIFFIIYPMIFYLSVLPLSSSEKQFFYVQCLPCDINPQIRFYLTFVAYFYPLLRYCHYRIIVVAKNRENSSITSKDDGPMFIQLELLLPTFHMSSNQNQLRKLWK